MTILIGGKSATVKPTRDGKHRQLTTEQIVKRHPAEPFPPIDSFRAETVEHRISVGCELKMWAEQKLDEMVPLADHECWLRLQLREPEYRDHPDRPEAQKELQELHDQLAEIASDVAYLEAHADRIWQSLDVGDRGPLALSWVADSKDDRIVMNAWTRIAQVGFTWPAYYSVQRSWFSCLAPPLIRDMEDRGLTDGISLGEKHEWETPVKSMTRLTPSSRSPLIEVESK